MRQTRGCTRVAATLIACGAIAAVGGGPASGATTVAGSPLPDVEVPESPLFPQPVNDAVGTVNETVGVVTDTVQGVTAPATEPVTEQVDRVTNPSSGSSQPAPSGGGSAAPTGGGAGGGGAPSASGAAPSGGGEPGSQTRRSVRGGDGDRGGARGERGDRRGDRGASLRPVAAAGGGSTAPDGGAAEDSGPSNPVAQVIERIVEVIPTPIKILIALLALVALAALAHARLAARRAKRLAEQREELLGDVGLLQRALLPDVPAALTGIEASVAYRPAEGPAAGGDFYDVFELDGGRTAIIVGDVCGHGRAALAVTALMRYTLRAYLGVGLEPRVALKVAARALEGDPEGALTTVVLAIYDPSAGTLTYACAGHEPPIVLGPTAYEPVTAFSAPPLGGSMPTGHRQTTVALPPGAAVCFFTDGLVEARLGKEMIGRERLSEMLAELAPESGAQLLLERLAQAADRAPDDMAACLVRVKDDAMASPAPRVEELEVDAADLEGDRVFRFLRACGVDPDATAAVVRAAGAKAAEYGGALIRVVAETGERRVEVMPREDTSVPLPPLDEARRRASYAASPSVSIS